MKTRDTLINYGINSELASTLIAKGLTVTDIKTLSIPKITSLYGLEATEVEYIKKLLKRQPIPENTVMSLLEKNLYTCCVCHGLKSDAFVIHHINPYSISRDNSYENLAVLCPSDHDLAHREGIGITTKLTQKQILQAKAKWETTVEKQNAINACMSGKYSHIEYCNIERIIELCVQTFGDIPKVELTDQLIHSGILLPSGLVNDKELNKIYPSRIVSPLNFFAGGGAVVLRQYFFQLFQKIIKEKGILDLDTFLNKTAVMNGGLEGKMCIYIGGIYGKAPKLPVTKDTPPIIMYIRRKPFYVTWTIDPRLMTSNTTTIRIGGHNIHFICGTIRSVGPAEIKGNKFIHFDIRPYIMGFPSIQFNRRPYISYRDDSIDLSDFFDEDE